MSLNEGFAQLTDHSFCVNAKPFGENKGLMFFFIFFTEQCQRSLFALSVQDSHGCVVMNVFVNHGQAGERAICSCSFHLDLHDIFCSLQSGFG